MFTYVNDRCEKCGEFFTPKVVKNDMCKCQRKAQRVFNNGKHISLSLDRIQKLNDVKANSDIKSGKVFSL